MAEQKDRPITCTTCGHTFKATPEIDEREERYNHTYEPYPVYCPECGSDELK